MELKPIYRCVAALDVHQAKLTVCVLYEDAIGETQMELREFGGFKKDRKAMAEWIASFDPDPGGYGEHGHLLEKPLCCTGEDGYNLIGCQCPSCEAGSWPQDRLG